MGNRLRSALNFFRPGTLRSTGTRSRASSGSGRSSGT